MPSLNVLLFVGLALSVFWLFYSVQRLRDGRSHHLRSTPGLSPAAEVGESFRNDLALFRAEMFRMGAQQEARAKAIFQQQTDQMAGINSKLVELRTESSRTHRVLSKLQQDVQSMLDYEEATIEWQTQQQQEQAEQHRELLRLHEEHTKQQHKVEKQNIGEVVTVAPKKPNIFDRPPASQQLFMIVFVFAFNRPEGLSRLFQSLVSADYMDHKVDLNVFVDSEKLFNVTRSARRRAGTPEEVVSTVSNVSNHESLAWIADPQAQWPHGTMRVHPREQNVGLKRAIMEAWYPLDDCTVAAFFEDDTEVSPLWYRWAVKALRRYYYPPAAVGADRLIGLGLYRPVFDETLLRSVAMDTQNQPFLLQQPCSWGAIYFPRPWRFFRDWYSAQGPTPPRFPFRTTINGWRNSWKRYLTYLMWQQGWVMVYPNLPNRMVLSTNHILPGVHPGPPRPYFELPLLTREIFESYEKKRTKPSIDLFSTPTIEKLQCYNLSFNRTASIAALPGAQTAVQLPELRRCLA